MNCTRCRAELDRVLDVFPDLNYCPRCGQQDPIPVPSPYARPPIEAKAPTSTKPLWSGLVLDDMVAQMRNGQPHDLTQACIEWQRVNGGAADQHLHVIIRFRDTVDARMHPSFTGPDGEARFVESARRNPSKIINNVTLDPHSEELRPWMDCRGHLVPRAAAIAYYCFGRGMQRKWHLDRPLSPRPNGAQGLTGVALAERGLAVVDEPWELNFALHYDGTMDPEKYWARLMESMELLQKCLTGGINTARVKHAAAGEIVGALVFAPERIRS